MKKSMLFAVLLILAFFPGLSFAQDMGELIPQEYKLPTVKIQANQDLVPAVVKNAAINEFGPGHKPFAFVNNSSDFSTWNWAQVRDPRLMNVYAYSLSTKTSTGSTLDANYTADGKLLNSREYLKNFKPSLNIMLALQNTQYKDWGVKKDIGIIKRFYNGTEKQRYALVMVKGNEKKTIHLDGNGKMLAEIPGAHLEFAALER